MAHLIYPSLQKALDDMGINSVILIINYKNLYNLHYLIKAY